MDNKTFIMLILFGMAIFVFMGLGVVAAMLLGKLYIYLFGVLS